jgi:mRNA interferase MazF
VKRREVWWVNFEPSVGGEIQKKRPAIIVSTDDYNDTSNRVQVVPLTSNTRRVYSCEALVVFEGHESKAMADQLTTASKMRFTNRVGIISIEDMQLVEKAIKVQLGL